MKNISYILFAFIQLVSSIVFAQTSTENYIQIRNYKTPQNQPILTFNKNHHLESIKYFDGLGRHKQTVLRQITPASKDLIQFQNTMVLAM